MKLGTCVFLGAAGLMSLGLTGVFTLQGCSGSSTAANNNNNDGGTGATGATGATGSDGGPGATGADAGPGTIPPVAPSGPTTTATTPHSFALHHIHLGDENDPATGMPDWGKYGYNLDGKFTTSSSKDVCTLYANANTKNQTDGPGGVDNSFGENIIPLLGAVAPNPSSTIGDSIAQGHFTVMMDVTGLDPSSATQTFTGLTGSLYGGTLFAQGPNAADAGPTFTTADNWPLDKTTITSSWAMDGGPQTLDQPVVAKNTFTGAYVVNGEFVSGAPTNVNLSVTLSGVPLIIPIQHAFITFNTPGTGGKTNASGGIIAGVIDAMQLVNNIQQVAGNISTSFCSGSTFAQIAKSINQAADIMDDATNVAGTPCNGISVGIGFDADEIAQPTVAGDPPPATNPCGDAGTAPDAGGTDSGTTTDSGSADATGE
jgi:hypothetical protein